MSVVIFNRKPKLTTAEIFFMIECKKNKKNCSLHTHILTCPKLLGFLLEFTDLGEMRRHEMETGPREWQSHRE